MLMPTERVDDMPHVFKPRNPPDSTYDVAWAHLDVSLIADLASRLAQDPMDPVLDQRADHTSMLYVFETVEDWKLEAHLAPRDDGTEKRIRQQAHPHGERLMRGLQRHATIRPPPIPLRCCICDGQAIQVWKRGPTNEHDVVCDREDCLASLLESEGAGDGNGDDTTDHHNAKPTKRRSARAGDNDTGDADSDSDDAAATTQRSNGLADYIEGEPLAKRPNRGPKPPHLLEGPKRCVTCHITSSWKWMPDGNGGIQCNRCYRARVNKSVTRDCANCGKIKTAKDWYRRDDGLSICKACYTQTYRKARKALGKSR